MTRSALCAAVLFTANDATSWRWRGDNSIVIIERLQHPSLRASARGQVAQMVERSPEKAGVGGSTPSLATMFSMS